MVKSLSVPDAFLGHSTHTRLPLRIMPASSGSARPSATELTRKRPPRHRLRSDAQIEGVRRRLRGKNYLPSTVSIPVRSNSTLARGSFPTRSVRRPLSRVRT